MRADRVIECLGPTNTRVYTVAVYFRGTRLAAARGHSIQEAEMHAAELALNSAHGTRLAHRPHTCTYITICVLVRNYKWGKTFGEC